MKAVTTGEAAAILAFLAFFTAQPTTAADSTASDGALSYNKTCYYCGIEEPCDLDFAKAKEDNNRVVSRGKKAELAEKRRHNLRAATATWHDHEDGTYYPYFVKLKAAYFVKP